jgi:MerR family transcriptional regulator, heat shock protein HspR
MAQASKGCKLAKKIEVSSGLACDFCQEDLQCTLRFLCPRFLKSMPHNEDEPVYVISVAARLAGLPCWVLRVLDDQEIVVPRRTDSNRRLYSDADIRTLARVRHLTEERHVNIAGVKVILEMEQAHAESKEQHDLPIPRQD